MALCALRREVGFGALKKNFYTKNSTAPWQTPKCKKRRTKKMPTETRATTGKGTETMPNVGEGVQMQRPQEEQPNAGKRGTKMGHAP